MNRIKWSCIALLTLSTLVSTGAFAQNSEEKPSNNKEKLTAYDHWNTGIELFSRAEKFEKDGANEKAYSLYNDALNCFRAIQLTDSEWNSDVIAIRIKMCRSRIHTVEQRLQAELSKKPSQTVNKKVPEVIVPKGNKTINITEAVASMEEELQALRQRNAILSAELQVAQQEGGNAGQVEALLAEKRKADDEISRLKVVTAGLEKKLASAPDNSASEAKLLQEQQKRAKMEEDIKLIRETLESSSKEYTVLNQKYQNTLKELAEAKATAVAMNAAGYPEQIAQQKKTLENLQNVISSAEKNLQEAKAENQTQNQLIKKLQTELIGATKNSKDSETIKILGNENIQLKKQVETLQKQSDELKKASQDSAQLVVQLGELRKSITNMQKETAALKHENDLLTKATAESKQLVQDANKERELVITEKEKLVKDFKDVSEKYEILQKTSDPKETNLTITALQAELADLKLKQGKSSPEEVAQLRQLQDNLTLQKTSLQRLEREKGELERNKAELAQRLEIANANINNIKNVIAERDALKSQIKDLATKLEKKKNYVSSEEFKDISIERDELLAKLETFDNLKVDLLNLNKKIQEQTKVLEKTKTENQKLVQEIQILKDSAKAQPKNSVVEAAPSEDTTELKLQLERKNEAIDTLMKEKTELMNQIQELKK